MCSGQSTFRAEIGQHDDELVTAVTGDQVDRARFGGKGLGDGHQEEITGVVAVVVVDALEPIEIDHHHATARATGHAC